MAVIEGSSSKRVGRNHFASYPLDMDEVERLVFCENRYSHMMFKIGFQRHAPYNY